MWRSADVRWDPATRAIMFAPRGQPPIVISGGTHITVGGEALPTDEPAGGSQPTAAGVRWLAPPDDQCATRRLHRACGTHRPLMINGRGDRLE